MTMRHLCVAPIALAAVLLGACAASDGTSAPPCAPATRSAAPAPASPLLAARPYTLDVPSNYDAATPAPLLVVLHGFASDGFRHEKYFGLGPVALAHGALLLVVHGNKDPNGLRFWNAGDACCDLWGSHPDDVAYLDAALDDVARRYSVDPKRVFLVGHSNGGFMATRYACERADRVAGFVSLAGAGPIDATKCAPTSPVAALQVHGDADDTIKFAGGDLSDPQLMERARKSGMKVPETLHAGPYPGARATIEMWAARNGCTGSDTSAPAIDLDRKIEGAETKVERWQGCKGGAAELWTIQGGSHSPELSPGWGERMYAFLAAHPKP